MADYLASIYGTEKDKVNCSFYFKIGACRHGELCSRKHVKPAFSQTIIIRNMYKNPERDENCTLSRDEVQRDVDCFYEDIFIEMAKLGKIEEMRLCDNIGEHLDGNVYIRFEYEEQAANAVDYLNSKFYAGRPIWAELSPVTDFEEACCRQYDLGDCNRGGVCNFMHLRRISHDLVRGLYKSQRKSTLLQSIADRESHREGHLHGRDRSLSPSSQRRYKSHPHRNR